MYFLLLLDSSSKNRELSSIDQLNRVKVWPLLHVTVELIMKQTSNTRNSPKYTFARSLIIPTESDVSVVRNDLRTWREAFLFVSNRMKAHKMAKMFKIQIAETTTDLGKIKFKAFSGE